jgi:cytochrome c peroxidase
MDDLSKLCIKLNATSYYPNLFYKAFGVNAATNENIALALTGFIQTLQSRNSKFDKSIPQFMNSQNPVVMVPLNALEQQGLTAFTSTYNCNTCHNISPNGYNGTNEGFANIGLDANYTDNGVGELTNKTADNGSFKIPNLRNVALTSPYMHDGRFKTLDEVLEHYSHNIQPNPNVSLLLKDFTILNKMFEKDDTTGAYLLPVQQKNISSADKKAIIAFLNTLTDFDFISNPMYSNPFIKK